MRAGGDLSLLVLATLILLVMQSGFAVRAADHAPKQDRVDALAKVLLFFAVSSVAYAVFGYYLSYGFHVRTPVLAPVAGGKHNLIQFLLLLTLATAVPAIVAGAVAQRARFWPQLVSAAVIAGVIYPWLEQIVWGRRLYAQHVLMSSFGAEFHDFSGAVLVHVMGGWLALVAVMLLGPRPVGHRQASETGTTFSLLGSWLLTLAWLATIVLNSYRVQAFAEALTVNGLSAIIAGALGALAAARGELRGVHTGALAGLIAICAGADVVNAGGAFSIGAVAGALVIVGADMCKRYWHVDDGTAIWSLHAVAGTWGSLATGVFAHAAFGGRGGISFMAQLIGTLGGTGLAIVAGFVIYGFLNRMALLHVEPREAPSAAAALSAREGPQPFDD
jgi:Amt family ammonium transporter